MKLYNITLTQSADKLNISCNDTPEPNDESLKYKRHSEGLSWHDYLMKEWKATRKTYPLKKECEDEIIQLVYAKLPHGENVFIAIKEGLNIDALSNRLELTTEINYCKGANYAGCIINCKSNNCSKDCEIIECFILTPLPVVEDETQEIWREVERVIYDNLRSPGTKIAYLKSKFTITRNK